MIPKPQSTQKILPERSCKQNEATGKRRNLQHNQQQQQQQRQQQQQHQQKQRGAEATIVSNCPAQQLRQERVKRVRPRPHVCTINIREPRPHSISAKLAISRLSQTKRPDGSPSQEVAPHDGKTPPPQARSFPRSRGCAQENKTVHRERNLREGDDPVRRHTPPSPVTLVPFQSESLENAPTTSTTRRTVTLTAGCHLQGGCSALPLGRAASTDIPSSRRQPMPHDACHTPRKDAGLRAADDGEKPSSLAPARRPSLTAPHIPPPHPPPSPPKKERQ